MFYSKPKTPEMLRPNTYLSQLTEEEQKRFLSADVLKQGGNVSLEAVREMIDHDDVNALKSVIITREEQDQINRAAEHCKLIIEKFQVDSRLYFLQQGSMGNDVFKNKEAGIKAVEYCIKNLLVSSLKQYEGFFYQEIWWESFKFIIESEEKNLFVIKNELAVEIESLLSGVDKKSPTLFQ